MIKNKEKKLPLYTNNLKEMITSNYIYVDKTEYIYRLMKDKAYYFLSRPRRFGKTLLVSTLKELFLGNKKLFENLWIGSSDYSWQEYPVIHLDFSIIPHLDALELRRGLNNRLKKIAQEYTVEINHYETPEETFNDLVQKLAEKNKVVILIDEYDKPILDHLKNSEKAHEQRDVLKSFYDVIKGLDPYLRAVFLTGVSRFSKTSLFSGINNLNDISLKPEAAQLLGYTQEELEKYFSFYIHEFAQKRKVSDQTLTQELKKWYNSYRFSEETIQVYNPFSVLYALNDKKLFNYWFESGTPTFLIHLIKQHYGSLETLNKAEIDQGSLGNFELTAIPLVPLLFQTGYLTIHDYDGKTGKFKLDFPNYEIELSFTKFLVASMAYTSHVVLDSLGSQLIRALNENDIEKFCSVLQTLFAHIPYTIDREDYYHALFQFLLSLLSLDAQSELITNRGRIDLVVSTKSHTYIFELKRNAKPEVALAQIKERGYYERFLHKGKAVVLVGLSFIHENEQMQLRYVQNMLD